MNDENIQTTEDVLGDIASDTATDTTTVTPGDDTSETPEDSKKYYYESLDEELVRYKVALDNALEDTELQEGFSRFGYDLTIIEAGNALYVNAENWFHKQQRDYALQYSATQRLTELVDAAEALFAQDRALARIAFKSNITVWTELSLSGERRKKRFGQWLHELEHFYSGCAANPGIIFGLEKFNITAEILQDRLTKLEAVKKANSYQERLKGNAQRATDLRDAAFTELRAWMSSFFKIARLAFAEDRQQLEKIKIVAKS